MNMEQRRFGNTELTTSPIGFGTWELSGTMYGEIDVAAASRAVGAAIDHGITLFDRRVAPEILPWCAANGVGFMSYGTLGFGLLTGAFSADTSFGDDDWRSEGSAFGLPLFAGAPFRHRLRVGARLAELAAEHGKTLAQLAIAWVLDHAPVTVALVGMRNARELSENVGAAGWKLTGEIRVQVDRIFAAENVPTYAGTPVTVRPNQQTLSEGDDGNE